MHFHVGWWEDKQKVWTLFGRFTQEVRVRALQQRSPPIRFETVHNELICEQLCGTGLDVAAWDKQSPEASNRQFYRNLD